MAQELAEQHRANPQDDIVNVLLTGTVEDEPLTDEEFCYFFLLLIVAGVTVWITNSYLTDRFTENTRNRAELRLALYSGNLLSELHRNAIVPQLLAKDPELIGALTSSDFSQSTARLISFVDEIGAASLLLLDEGGRTVAA